MNIEKRYKTDVARAFLIKIVAKDYRGDLVVKVFADGSACLYNFGRNGYADCFFCGLDELKEHLKHLAHLQNRNNLIPADWTVTEPKFFEAYGIA